MRHLLLIPLLLVGCDDYLLDPDAGSDGIDTEAAGWCVMQQVIADDCLVCHSAASKLGDLDLETDPHAALVGASSGVASGRTLVIPGDAASSFLTEKLVGELDAGEGGPMPPGEPLDAAVIDAIRAWIDEGADAVCDETIDTDGGGRHHPIGFADPDEHGMVAKFGEQACVDCHGADLTGQGSAVSCDTCHTPGWRTDCTYCHGDPATGEADPPVHLTGQDEGRSAIFSQHRTHSRDSALKTGFDCTECHVKPTDVLTPGHVFVGDTTPARADVDFSAGLSDATVWNAGAATCSNLYCHGFKGRDNGTMDHRLDRVETCHDCHPDMTSGRSAWDNRMSRTHEDHLRDNNARCEDCHGGTTTNSTSIANASLHVDGVVQVQLPNGITRSGNSCAGVCHGQDHTAGEEVWRFD